MFQLGNIKNILDTFGPVFDNIKDGIIITSNCGTILYANSAVLEMIGYEFGEVVNSNYLKIKELEWINRLIETNYKVKIFCKGSTRIQWADIDIKKIDNNTTVYILHKSKVTGTQRYSTAAKSYKFFKTSKKSKITIDAYPKLLKKIINGLGIGMLLYSSDFRVIETNKTYLDFFSDIFTTTDIIGLTHDQFINKDHNLEVLHNAWNNYIPQNKGFIIRELAINFTSQKYCRFKLSPIRKNGKIKYWLELIVDITEQVKLRKSAMQLAKKNEEKINQFNALINSMTDSVWIFDKNANLVDTNKAVIDMYGVDFTNENVVLSSKDICDKIRSRDINNRLYSKDELSAYQSLNGKIIKNKEGIIKNVKTGKDVYISSSSSPIYTKSGNITGAVIVIRDISDKIIAQKQKEELNKMKDDFIAIISHELRTPIAIIDSALQSILTLYPKDLTPNVKNLLEKIKQNSFRLTKLSNNFLDITKAQAGFITPYFNNIDIVFLTRDIIRSAHSYAKSKDIKLSFRSSIKNIIIALDQDKYERILMNLLSNSIKFTPTGKSVIVSVYLKNDKVCISVKDTGIGIPKEKLDKIFDRFIQVSSVLSRGNEGSGLGLSISKMLVNSLGGDITVQSQEGIGSQFIIQLPNRIVKEQDIINDSNIYSSKNYLSKKANIEFSDIYMNTK